MRGRGISLLLLMFVWLQNGLSQTFNANDREKVLQHLRDVFGNPGKQSTAIQSIQAMGTNAVPHLIEILGYQQSQADAWYEQVYDKAPKAVQQTMSKPAALEKLRGEAKFLLRNMPETRLYLTKITPLLQNSEPAVRQGAAYLLMGNSRWLQQAELLECIPSLKDSDSIVRLYTAYAFADSKGKLSPRAELALGTLLQDPVEEVRIAAANALLGTDENYPAALQALETLFNSTDATIQYLTAAYYMNSNSSQGRLDDKILPIFVSTISGTNTDLRAPACYALSRFGERAKAAVPVLLKHLQSTDPELQKAAREALEKIAPEALSKKP